MPNAQHIMTSIVKKLGVSVEFITAEFADSVAALAYHRKADILSRDWNMVNYYWDRGGDVNVYYKWKIGRDGRLHFQRNIPKPDWASENPKKDIPTRGPPHTSPFANPLDTVPVAKYIRGFGSNLTQLHNPHIKVII